MILSVYNSLIELVNKEFKDICEDADIMFSTTGRTQKVRIYLIDNTIVDVWLSRDGRYSLFVIFCLVFRVEVKAANYQF